MASIESDQPDKEEDSKLEKQGSKINQNKSVIPEGLVETTKKSTSKSSANEEDSSDDEADTLSAVLHHQLRLGADAEDEIKKVLILLDFNGMLVFRAKDRVGKIKPDYSVRFTHFYVRPFAREIVCHLLNDPRCKVLSTHTHTNCTHARIEVSKTVWHLVTYVC